MNYGLHQETVVRSREGQGKIFPDFLSEAGLISYKVSIAGPGRNFDIAFEPEGSYTLFRTWDITFSSLGV